VRGDNSGWQVLQVAQHKITLSKVSERNLADDKWMDQYFSAVQEPGEDCIVIPKVIDPD
jgi:hypothetical protein